jgi:hypothetical protein
MSEKTGKNSYEINFLSFSFENLHCSNEGRKMLLAMSINNSENQIIEEIMRLMRRDDSVDAPQNAIQWSKNIFRTRAVEPKKSFVHKILAVLQMDLAPNQVAFGERSVSAAQERQMLFEAGENAFDLRIKKTEKGFTVRGQILGENSASAAVKLGDSETKTDELGEFSFSRISEGEYDLTVRIGDSEITIEKLEIK